MEERSRQLKKDIIPTSSKASIEDDDLKIFIADERIEASSTNETTERQTQQCVEEWCKHEVRGE